jgi:hypothetical protein
MESLSDYIQGPNNQSQHALLEAGVVEVLSRWRSFVQTRSQKLAEEMSTKQSFPPFWTHSVIPVVSSSFSVVRDFWETEDWELYSQLLEIELSTLELLYNVLDGNPEERGKFFCRVRATMTTQGKAADL